MRHHANGMLNNIYTGTTKYWQM